MGIAERGARSERREGSSISAAGVKGFLHMLDGSFGATTNVLLMRAGHLMKLLIVLAGIVAMTENVIVAVVEQPSAIKIAMDTVSAELQVPRSAIELVSSAPAEWPDSSLGCAQRGERYRPAVTSGWTVTLAFEGDRAVVHVSGERAVICSHTRSTKVSSASLAVAAAKMTKLARTDLAARLNVPEQRIDVDAAKPSTWPNAALGCPDAGRVYPDVAVAGFVIRLTHDKKTYIYHSDMQARVVSCPEEKK